MKDLLVMMETDPKSVELDLLSSAWLTEPRSLRPSESETDSLPPHISLWVTELSALPDSTDNPVHRSVVLVPTSGPVRPSS